LPPETTTPLTRGEDLAELDLAEDPSVLATFELEPLVHAKA
jgi:hypothetical protein